MDIDSERNVLILYATETGNSEDAAERVGRRLRASHTRARVVSMDDYSFADLLEESIVVFICSTTGNGVEPQSMTRLWQALLRADLPPDLFDHIDVAVFGLGDSSYERFCWASKKLHRRLKALGAHDIIDRADADEQHYLGLDGTLIPWIESLVAALNELFPLHLDESLPGPSTYSPRVSFSPSPTSDSLNRIYPPGTHRTVLKATKRITREDWFQDVRHIEFEATDEISYEPGDIALLYPTNDPADVERLIYLQSWGSHADTQYTLRAPNPDRPLPKYIPTALTLRQLVSQHLDISAVPRRSFFEVCRDFASDEREREKLEEFCSPEGQDELYSYCQRPRRTALEVLGDFKSVKIPLDYVFEVFSTIRPRKFSISSALRAHPGQIHLCVAIVRYKSLSLKAPRRGLCSHWLTRLKTGDIVHVGLQKGVFSVPDNSDNPVVLIGPGTGIAPMRAILEHRKFRGARENLLYFGCRSVSADFLYQGEILKYVQDNWLFHRVAASRDQERKIYVQDEIIKDGYMLHDFLVQRKGRVYISGSSNKMPAAVRKAVQGALRAYESWSETQATEYIAQMERDGRWQEECWS